MRRDSSDLQWQRVKDIVRKRDRNQDRLLSILTVKEALLLQKRAPHIQLKKLDCAHFLPVSTHPELCYVSVNICLLNRYSHENLDSMKDPVTGDPITKEEHDAWWERILGPSQFSALQKWLARIKEPQLCLDSTAASS